MNTLSVLVVDDDKTLADDWADRIKRLNPTFHVHAPEPQTLRRDIKTLQQRQRLERDPDKVPAESDQVPAVSCLFDSLDVLIVDYDLLLLESDQVVTGAELAYLARCYANTKFIIILNEYGENHFDLTGTTDLQSFADLHIGAYQIDNPGLWTHDWAGFRPWAWPVIIDAVAQYDACVTAVQENLDNGIIEYFGISQVLDFLGNDDLNFLATNPSRQSDNNNESDTTSITDRTFRGLIDYANGGLHRGDKISESQYPRVAASRLIALLNRSVLPKQDLLIDAPHLVRRMPSLLNGSLEQIDDWNQLAQLGSSITSSLISSASKHSFGHDEWMWRPVWVWPSIRNDEQIADVANPWSTPDPPFEFCEDLSRFLPHEAVQSYVMGVASKFRRRHLADPTSSIYADFLGDQSQASDRTDPANVTYHPTKSFSNT